MCRRNRIVPSYSVPSKQWLRLARGEAQPCLGAVVIRSFKFTKAELDMVVLFQSVNQDFGRCYGETTQSPRASVSYGRDSALGLSKYPLFLGIERRGTRHVSSNPSKRVERLSMPVEFIGESILAQLLA